MLNKVFFAESKRKKTPKKLPVEQEELQLNKLIDAKVAPAAPAAAAMASSEAPAPAKVAPAVPAHSASRTPRRAAAYTNADLAHPFQGLTDKQVRRLKRVDLLELLVAQGDEIESLRTQLAQAQAQLASKDFAVSDAGNIAEAALRINNIFESAQAAADQFLHNVRAHACAEACPARQSQTKAAQ